MIALGDTLYFTVVDDNHGHELWKSDGTAIGTVMVKDIRSDSTSSIHISLGVVFGNSLYFTADDRTHGRELWKSDGTETGTVMVEDVGGPSGSLPGSLTVFGNAFISQPMMARAGMKFGSTHSEVQYHPYSTLPGGL